MNTDEPDEPTSGQLAARPRVRNFTSHYLGMCKELLLVHGELGVRIHKEIETRVSPHPIVAHSFFTAFRAFVEFVEGSGQRLEVDTVSETFDMWISSIRQVLTAEKSMSRSGVTTKGKSSRTALSQARRVGSVLKSVLGRSENLLKFKPDALQPISQADPKATRAVDSEGSWLMQVASVETGCPARWEAQLWMNKCHHLLTGLRELGPRMESQLEFKIRTSPRKASQVFVRAVAMFIEFANGTGRTLTETNVAQTYSDWTDLLNKRSQDTNHPGRRRRYEAAACIYAGIVGEILQRVLGRAENLYESTSLRVLHSLEEAARSIVPGRVYRFYMRSAPAR